jgi:hypothetical protein
MGNATRNKPLPRISKNTILRDKINDEQVRLAKSAPQMIKNPKKRTNDERNSLLTGDR